MDDILKNLPASLLASVKSMMEGKPALDPVNKQTKDVDNDGDVDNSDKFLAKRRKAISSAMRSEEVEPIEELSVEKLTQYKKKATPQYNQAWLNMKNKLAQKRGKGLDKADDKIAQKKMSEEINLDDDLFVVEDLSILEEGAGVLKDLSKGLKKVVTSAGGGEHSEHSSEKATSNMHYKSLIHNGLKKGHTVVVHHNGKPIAAVKPSYDAHHVYDGDTQATEPRSEKRHRTGTYDRRTGRFIPTEYNTWNSTEHKIGEAKSKVDHIVRKHIGEHPSEKGVFKKHDVTVSTYGKDNNRKFVHALRNTRVTKDKNDPILNKALDKMATKHLGHIDSPHAKAKEIHGHIAAAIEKGDNGLARKHTESLEHHLRMNGVDKTAYKTKDYKVGLVDLKKAYKRGDSWDKKYSRERIKRVVGEETELDTTEDTNLNELSRQTLGSYAKKAISDAGDLDRAGNTRADMARHFAATGDKPNAKHYGNAAAHSSMKSMNRRLGTIKAIDKMSEETELDEGNYTELHALKNRIAFNQRKYRALHAADSMPSVEKKKLAIRIEKDTRRHSELFKEETELDEARGRPKRANPGYTIHPNTKEKLMHSNPAHMARIETLQKNGVIPKTNIEASQHIMQQLQKAKISMTGGAKVAFNDGSSHDIKGSHAASLISKYTGMKPHEKETFQKKIQQSRAHMMGALDD